MISLGVKVKDLKRKSKSKDILKDLRNTDMDDFRTEPALNRRNKKLSVGGGRSLLSDAKKLKKKLLSFDDINESVDSYIFNFAQKNGILLNTKRIAMFQRMIEHEIKKRNVSIEFGDELAAQIKSKLNSKASKRSAVNRFFLTDHLADYSLDNERKSFDYDESVVEVFDKSFKAGHSGHSMQINSVNDVEDDEESSEDSPVVSESREDSFKLFVLSNSCIAVLKPSSKVFFCGKIKASLISGDVEVMGHKLTEQSQELYSTCTSSLLYFESKIRRDRIKLSSVLYKLGANEATVDSICEYTERNDSILMLEPLNNEVTDFIAKYVVNYSIFSRKQLPIKTAAQQLLQCVFYSENDVKSFSEMETWENVVARVRRNEATVICGGKNVGKSTMLRYIVNKSLKDGPVLVIDLDPGQSEFTICGTISATVVRNPLLGPNFTHLQETERSLCLGYINVVEDVHRYVNAVIDLIDFCRRTESYSDMPWIINTMGFVGSQGVNLLTNLMMIIRPAVVIELQGSTSYQNFKNPLTKDAIVDFKNSGEYQSYLNEDADIPAYDYHSIEPYQTGKKFIPSVHVEAKLERLLNVLAYFSRLTADHNSLLDIQPYSVPLNSIKLGFNNIHVDHEYIPSVLNSRLVALCSQDADASERIFKLRDRPVVSYGFGLVRGIGTDSIYILTPVNFELLHKINTLVYVHASPDCSSLLSMPSANSKTFVPYATPVVDSLENMNLHQFPKRKINTLRLFKINKNK